MNFTHKVVLVTGAGRGIGRAVALAYGAAGAHVVIGEIDPLSGQETCDLIVHQGGVATALPTDVRKPEEILNLIRHAVDQFGTIDILINNVGVSVWTSPYELTVEGWDDLIQTNLRSVFLCSREAARVMREMGGGSIVNISSTRSAMSEPHTEAYAASKGGIVSLTHALAASLAPDRIQVNAISPGWIETGDYSQLSDADHQQHFAGRVGKPEDIAKACLWLTQPGNTFVSGTNITIDGGMTRKMIYREEA